jgi:quercetin dioxygenase-like cupin family protein
MRIAPLFCLVALLVSGIAGADPARTPPGPTVTTLMTQKLQNEPGKEVLMLTVEYPPGGADPVHRHNAEAFVYVLEGSIVMGLNDGKTVTLKPGETFYEGPTDVHTVGRNASETQPAKFVVFLLKDANAPALIPVKEGTK